MMHAYKSRHVSLAHNSLVPFQSSSSSSAWVDMKDDEEEDDNDHDSIVCLAETALITNHSLPSTCSIVNVSWRNINPC